MNLIPPEKNRVVVLGFRIQVGSREGQPSVFGASGILLDFILPVLSGGSLPQLQSIRRLVTFLDKGFLPAGAGCFPHTDDRPSSLCAFIGVGDDLHTADTTTNKLCPKQPQVSGL